MSTEKINVPPIPTVSRNRYPWQVWASPGAGPFLVPPDEADPHKLASVLRTWSIRKDRPVRLRQTADGLLFQFGPPFSPLLDVAARRTVSPGTELDGSACPTCGRDLNDHADEEG